MKEITQSHDTEKDGDNSGVRQTPVRGDSGQIIFTSDGSLDYVIPRKPSPQNTTEQPKSTSS